MQLQIGSMLGQLQRRHTASAAHHTDGMRILVKRHFCSLEGHLVGGPAAGKLLEDVEGR